MTLQSVILSCPRRAPGSNIDDGLACDITAIEFKVYFQDETFTKNYTVKYSLQGPRLDYLNKVLAFEREVLSYTFIIPALQEIRKMKKLKPLAFAKCFYASTDDHLILMENKKSQHFINVMKKHEALGIDAINLILNELAAFHATGLHFIETHTGGENALQENYPIMFTRQFFGGSIEGKKTLRKFLVLGAKMFQACCRAVIKTSGDSNLISIPINSDVLLTESADKLLAMEWNKCLLIHGDAWYNNFIYRFEKDDSIKPTDLTILDLLGTQLGRLGIELTYFIFTSTSTNQRLKNLQNFLRFYLEKFNLELKNLGCRQQQFTFDDLQHEFNACLPYGFLMGFLHT